MTPAAASAPALCARINAGASTGLIPENVSLAPRARVPPGLAKEVDAVNQNAAVA